MTNSPLEDAFGHHVWATLRVVDACLALSPEQLETAVPGTYGSILETVRHLVGADASYLFVMTGGRRSEIEEAQMDLGELRSVMSPRHGSPQPDLHCPHHPRHRLPGRRRMGLRRRGRPRLPDPANSLSLGFTDVSVLLPEHVGEGVVIRIADDLLPELRKRVDRRLGGSGG